MQQLDLFEKDQSLYLWGEIQKVKETGEHVRRGLFKRYNELERLVLELKDKVDERT